MLYELFISLRYLVSKKRQKFVSVTALISIFGVLIGVMALNVVLAVMGGFEDELRNKILGVSSHIAVLSYDGPIEKYDILTNEITDIPGVAASCAVAPVRQALGREFFMRTAKCDPHIKAVVPTLLQQFVPTPPAPGTWR